MFKEKLDLGRILEVVSRAFKPRPAPLIGVDISSSAVKLVEMSIGGKGRYRLERYAIEPLPKGAVVDGNIANLEEVGEVVRRGWKKLGTRVKAVAIALPSAAVITRKIAVPAGLRERELETQVESEANQYIPFALDEVNLDFQIIGPVADNPGEVEVLIAASRKEKVEDRVAVAEAAGLKALILDIDSFAAQHAFELIEPQLAKEGADQAFALVDVGASVMTVNVIRNRQSVYFREQPFGGDQLTQEIQRAFSLSPEEAEEAKKNGGLPENYERDVLNPFMETLALEITRALQLFFTSTQVSEVDCVILAGGCSTLPGVEEVVANRADVPVLIANPFESIEKSDRIKSHRLALDAPALMVACGLAMRRLEA